MIPDRRWDVSASGWAETVTLQSSCYRIGCVQEWERRERFLGDSEGSSDPMQMRIFVLMRTVGTDARFEGEILVLLLLGFQGTRMSSGDIILPQGITASWDHRGLN